MIFCVEDDNNIRDLLVYTLETTGFHARGLEDSQELWKALAEEGQAPADLEASQVSRRKETSPEQEVTVLDLDPAQVRRAGVQRTPGGPVPPVIQEDDGLLQGLAECRGYL